MTPTLIRLRSEGRRNGDARTFPTQLRRAPGSACRTRSTPCTAFRSRADYVIRVGLGGLRPAGSDADHASRCGSTSAQAASAVYDAEQAARFDIDRQDFGGQAVQFRAEAARGRSRRSPWRSRASSRGCPRAAAGPTRRRGPNRRAGVHAAARRDARADRPAAQAVRRDAGDVAEASR